MPGKKITCLGAGSYYFPRALGDIAITKGLDGSEVTLYDLDIEKAEIMATLGRRFAQEAGSQTCFRACAELADAVDGADFAISSIGGSGPSMGGVYGTTTHNADVDIPAKYGIYQIVGDTGGPAGMMMGLRSIPAYLAICEEMTKRCPDVVILNHSNPMSILCRAMLKYGGISNIIGICHGVQGGICQLAHLLGVEPEALETVWIGTNHYYWFTRIRLAGKDIYPNVFKEMAKREPPHGEIMCEKLSEVYRHRIVYAEDGHVLEFYPFLAQAGTPGNLPYGYDEVFKKGFMEPCQYDPSLSPEALREQQLAKYKEELNAIELPQPNESLVTSEGVARMIESIAIGRREVRIVNIPNKGCVPNLPDYAILELEGVTDSCGVRGIQAGEAPLSLMGLLQKRIAWQELVVEAAVKGDRNLALQALLMDEMAIIPEKAEAMLDELLAASRNLLPQF